MRRIREEQTGASSYLQPTSQNVIVPIPVGGWNARDPVSLMEPKFANVMDNWVPRPGWVEPRLGYSAWCQNVSGLASPAGVCVESLLPYRSSTGEKLFAACNGQIIDVSTQGLPSIVQTGGSNDRWQWVNFTPAQGSTYLWIVNGQDTPRYYNGSTWTNASINTSAFSGPAQTTFVNIAVWKRRIFFVQQNSTIAWIMPTDAIDGAVATFLDIGAVLTKGGTLQAIGQITVIGGNGPNALLVLASSEGEYVVYQGTDPTNAQAFGIVGVFDVAPPIGSRCFMQYGPDLVAITTQGLLPLSQSFPVDVSAVRSVSVTNNIVNAVLSSAQMYATHFGWELKHFPAQGFIILNVPTTENGQQVQYVQNMLTGAWFRITGWNSNTFEIFQGNLYWGDNNGNVFQGWSGSADLISPIVSDMQCAFNYFGSTAAIKRMTMVQPLIISSGALTPTISVDADFSNNSPVAALFPIQPAGSLYGMAMYGAAAFNTSSTSSNTIGTGSFTFTVASSTLSISPGQPVTATATAGNSIIGTVTSYSGSTLIINGTTTTGSGTFASWTIVGTAVLGGAYGGGTITQTSWFAAEAQGKALAVRMKVNLAPVSPAGASTAVFDTGLFDTMVFDGFGTSTNTLQIHGFNALTQPGGII